MKAAVIGGGFIGNAHVEALRRLGDVEVVALCDAYNSREKADRLNIRFAYSDFRKMMEELELDVCISAHPTIPTTRSPDTQSKKGFMSYVKSHLQAQPKRLRN